MNIKLWQANSIAPPKQAACSRESLDLLVPAALRTIYTNIAVLSPRTSSLFLSCYHCLVLSTLLPNTSGGIPFEGSLPTVFFRLIWQPIRLRGPIYCQRLDNLSQSPNPRLFHPETFTATLPQTTISLSSRLDLTHILRPRFGMYHLVAPASGSYQRLHQYV